MTVDDIIEMQLKPIADDGFADALEILQLIAILEAQNTNGVNKGLNKAGAGRAAMTAKNALITRLTLLVVRCYAKPREGDLHIRKAFDIIAKDVRVSEELMRRHSGEPLKTAQANWLHCRGDHRLQRLEHFRDKYTAHFSKPNEDIPLPKYNELFPFAVETTSLMESLAHAVGANTHKLSDWDSEINASAESFWKPWASSP